jgi:hypothetical protein
VDEAREHPQDRRVGVARGGLPEAEEMAVAPGLGEDVAGTARGESPAGQDRGRIEIALDGALRAEPPSRRSERLP